MEYAQKQSGQAENTITNTQLLLIATTAMFYTQQFPSANDKLEDTDLADKTWEEWKMHFKSAGQKANVSRAALITQDQSGASHGAGLLAPPDTPTLDQTKVMDEYFDALAAAASTEKEILEDLVLSNTVLTKSNTKLTETTVKLGKIIADLTGQLKRAQGNKHGGGKENKQNTQTTNVPNCKVDGFHKPDNCFELVKNKAKHPAAWKICLWQWGSPLVSNNKSNSYYDLLSTHRFRPTNNTSATISSPTSPVSVKQQYCQETAAIDLGASNIFSL